MSREDAEVVREAYDAYAQGDVEAMLDFLDPAVEIRDSGEIPDPEIHHGHAGFMRSQLKFAEVFPNLRIEPVDVIDAGDRIVVLANAVGREERTGSEILQRVAAVWTMREGKAVLGVYYGDWDQALEVVGLRE
jgi:ketosteroid isomerase-like protein